MGDEPHPHGCSFMDVVCVAYKFKRLQKSDNRDRVLRVEEMRFFVRLHLRHQFGKIAWNRIVVLRGTIWKFVCLLIDGSNVTLLTIRMERSSGSFVFALWSFRSNYSLVRFDSRQFMIGFSILTDKSRSSNFWWQTKIFYVFSSSPCGAFCFPCLLLSS